ncbi:MAG: Na(+)-translocating NADH-quinone reductase subunit C [Nitrincola lacisaponensis]|uniref:Na(+)-translocating NADH-quinone reductase subunit C n=1 Tax=Nitrincola lacisaponensis TaxID=267850 RepID=A0A063Y2M2_9GAMM|nr:Na(+)-translocating NADH-quinone reductase subunit C [Nitrincola lacisaponensis]KDE39924.1 Na(+)-translocating NADH-quinone reductase subunit C [Nitrincola lacisaponensis]
MSSNKDSIGRTIIVALVLCVVCSVVVSAAAVMLKPMQQYNMDQDRKSNILRAAGIVDPSKSVDELFEQITTRTVNLQAGQFTEEFMAEVEDFRRAAGDPSLSRSLSRSEDVASIKRQPLKMPVYIVEAEDGSIEKLILPIHGYGLWSTMYGFLALEGDLNTVAGLGFYEHAETPGLGGEIDNPSWRASWIGKQIYSGESTDEPALRVIKGAVDPSQSGSEYRIDGLAGATLTANGVTNMIRFWMGESGFGPFIANLRAASEAGSAELVEPEADADADVLEVDEV